MKQAVYVAATFAACTVCAAAAQAQGLSDAELIERFRAQMQSIHAANDPSVVDPSVGATRGLVLLSPGQDTAAEVTIETAPAPKSTGAPLKLNPGDASSTETASEGAEGAPISTHYELPKNEQVNVQVTFGFDSSALEDAQKPKLAQICEVLDKAGVGVLRVVGHTDASGPWSYNQKLSELRAQEVVRFFVNDCGIPAGRLQAVGVGEQFPYDDKNPRAGVNRRVEFQAIS